MTEHAKINYFSLFLSIMIAYLLELLPAPTVAAWFIPEWLLLVTIYWSLYHPYQLNIFFAWCLGLILDVMKGNLLGEHALAMIVVIFIVSKMHRRLRLYSMWQQSLAILIFVLIYLGIIYLIQGAIDQLPNTYYYWGASVTSMIFWPWIYSVLQNSQRRVQTS